MSADRNKCTALVVALEHALLRVRRIRFPPPQTLSERPCVDSRSEFGLNVFYNPLNPILINFCLSSAELNVNVCVVIVVTVAILVLSLAITSIGRLLLGSLSLDNFVFVLVNLFMGKEIVAMKYSWICVWDPRNYLI